MTQLDSSQENHRTDMELKSSMAVKLFAVKFVVFYFPFVYDIVLRPRVEGPTEATERLNNEKKRHRLIFSGGGVVVLVFLFLGG